MNEGIRSRIEALLTQEYVCSPELLNQGGIIYTIKPEMEKSYIKLLAYRHGGLATYLVNALTQKLLAQGIVPFYSASVTNIGSQMVASRCNYIPAWIDTYGTRYKDAKADV